MEISSPDLLDTHSIQLHCLLWTTSEHFSHTVFSKEPPPGTLRPLQGNSEACVTTQIPVSLRPPYLIKAHIPSLTSEICAQLVCVTKDLIP